MKVGDTCYIVLNNRIVEEVVIKSISGNLYTLRFTNKDKAIRLPKHRLYDSVESAYKSVGLVYEEGDEMRVNRPPEIH